MTVTFEVLLSERVFTGNRQFNDHIALQVTVALAMSKYFGSGKRISDDEFASRLYRRSNLVFQE